jgi:hypothetical protein
MKTNIYDHFCARCRHEVKCPIRGILCGLTDQTPDLLLGCMELEQDPVKQEAYERRHRAAGLPHKASQAG